MLNKITKQAEMGRKIRVLVEANKISSNDRDGISRYVTELLCAMATLNSRDETQWHIDVFMGQIGFYSIVNLQDLLSGKNKSSVAVAPIKRQKRIYSLLQLKDICITRIRDFFPQWLIQSQKRMNSPFHSFIFNRYPAPKFESYDVVHLTLPQSYPHFQNCQTKMVTTIHDLTHLHFPQFHLKENITNVNRGMQLVMEKKSEFIAVSNATRHDLLSNYPMIPPDTVHVVYEACNTNQFKPSNNPDALAAIRSKYKIPKHPFILSLSTLEPRKNLINAIRAFIQLICDHPELPVNFVIAGKMGWKQDMILNLAASRPDRIFFTGFVQDDDLAMLYSAAVAFSYVSFYEGFGLPPLEAMACGTPVVYGNSCAMREIIGDGGLMADPNDIEDIKDKYETLVINKTIRSHTAKMALARARHFSWELTAKQTLEVYKKAASKTG